MTPLLLIKCKLKYLATISMILFGLGLIALGSFFIYSGSSWWWIIALLFGVFCTYNWTSILMKGSRSIAFLVKGNLLYISFDKSKIIAENLEAINAGDFYTKTYSLSAIENFWKYTYKVNGSTTTEELKMIYDGQEEILLDLNEFEVKLKEDDLDKIARFLLHFNPNIQIGKP